MFTLSHFLTEVIYILHRIYDINFQQSFNKVTIFLFEGFKQKNSVIMFNQENSMQSI